MEITLTYYSSAISAKNNLACCVHVVSFSQSVQCPTFCSWCRAEPASQDPGPVKPVLITPPETDILMFPMFRLPETLIHTKSFRNLTALTETHTYRDNKTVTRVKKTGREGVRGEMADLCHHTHRCKCSYKEMRPGTSSFDHSKTIPRKFPATNEDLQCFWNPA